ncbi:MAG: OmpA family protein [Tateyamaria sp.]|jgi:OOP family OmpA-OmpF porin|nr:OmpA family protein [Tateyamaria sp.]
MHLSSVLIIVASFFSAALLSMITANFSVKLIEDKSEIGVRSEFDKSGMTWAEVEANGLQVIIAGVAPTEALRFAALSTAGGVVDAARIIDEMQIKAVADIAPPRFSAEILLNDAGLSIIGLIPASTDRADILEQATKNSDSSKITDLIETADYPTPEGWQDALGFALFSMTKLQRAKISVQAGRVAIDAITDSAKEQSKLEKDLNRAAPPGLRLTLNISAPRPVITPFTLRLVKDERSARFDSCSANTEKARQLILNAANRAGLQGRSMCILGMGSPSPKWGIAVEQGIDAITKLGTGSITFSDTDVTIVAGVGTTQVSFDRIIGELENNLPAVFALYAKLPETEDSSLGPQEFIATLSPEGLVQLRGRLANENMRNLTESYARATFGTSNVYMAARLVSDLPDTWTLRILTGLEALSKLSYGVVTVTPNMVVVSGSAGEQMASTKIASLLAAKLGEAEEFDIKVTYIEKLDPIAALPTPDECEAEIAAIVAISKITFEPGSATINASALGTMDDIAEILRQCGDLKLEVQGHTDSQGREEMNLNLSQARAQSVLNELRARRVLTSTYTAKGYGEINPIADNKEEAGREANRRIEFRLLRPEPAKPEMQTTLETIAGSSDIEAETDGAAKGKSDESN